MKVSKRNGLLRAYHVQILRDSDFGGTKSLAKLNVIGVRNGQEFHPTSLQIGNLREKKRHLMISFSLSLCLDSHSSNDVGGVDSNVLHSA